MPGWERTVAKFAVRWRPYWTTSGPMAPWRAINGSISDGKTRARQEITGAVVEADTGPSVHRGVRSDEIDQSSHREVSRAGRTDPAGRIERIPLDERFELAG